MTLPKFILGDNSEFPEAIFVIHTEFPRFIINLENDEVTWLEEFDKEDQKVLEEETETAIEEASKFYDSEVANYEND
jgi:oligoribonuclease NrnB/cAMP/cGMP phosphodiesterase (DHH superfamily)